MLAIAKWLIADERSSTQLRQGTDYGLALAMSWAKAISYQSVLCYCRVTEPQVQMAHAKET
jgi:hypothetical protein